MASIASKLARASFATRASPSVVGGIAGGARPAAAIHVSPAGGPKTEEEEKASSKSEVAPHASIIHPKPYLDVDESVFKSKEAMWAFYEYWCKYHGKFHDRREMERRFKTFSDTARLVHKINNSGVKCKVAMSKFADMTKKECTPRLLDMPKKNDLSPF